MAVTIHFSFLKVFISVLLNISFYIQTLVNSLSPAPVEFLQLFCTIRRDGRTLKSYDIIDFVQWVLHVERRHLGVDRQAAINGWPGSWPVSVKDRVSGTPLPVFVVVVSISSRQILKNRYFVACGFNSDR